MKPFVLAVAVLAMSTSVARADVPSLTDIALRDGLERELSVLGMPATAQEVALDEHVRAGRHWRLETDRGPVHVWIPAAYDAATAATVVFVHGYWIDVDKAWTEYRLPHQFALSGINAMFVAPAAPASKRDALVWTSLNALLRTVSYAVDVSVPSQRVVAVGHSGAYRTLVTWLPNPSLDTIVLLDALYGESRFLPWVRASKERRFVNVAYETQKYSDYFHRWLPSTVRVEGLPESGFPDARILYARTNVGHWAVVTDGIALPLALRASGVVAAANAPVDVPLGLPQRCDAHGQPLVRLSDLER